MKTRIWVTFTSLESNFRPYGISFSNGYDCCELRELMLKKSPTPEDQDRIAELGKMVSRIRYRYLNFTSIGQVPISLHRSGEENVAMHPFTVCRILDSFLILSEACAAVLSKFNLGTTEIHPVKFKDGKSRKLYYFLNITECRWYLMKNKCEAAGLESVKSTTGDAQYKLKRSAHKDYSIAVSSSAGRGDLDLWHDPELKNSIFMSDRLRKELESKGLSADWGIKECRALNPESNPCR